MGLKIYEEGRTQIASSSSGMIGSSPKISIESILIFGKEPIVVDELGRIWVLPSPQILPIPV